MHIHTQECAHIQYCIQAHTHNQSESEMRAYEAFKLAALPAVYSFTIHVQYVSKVLGVFDVKSSSALLMLISSLASCIMSSK